MVAGLLALSSAFAAKADLRPYTEKPTLSLRALPAKPAVSTLNPKVRLVKAYDLVVTDTEQFHGLSDLRAIPQGAGVRIEAISDLGAAISFDLKPGAPIDIDHLRGEDGIAYINRLFNDAEDVAFDSRTNTRYVSFERTHRVMAFRNGWRGQTVRLTGLPVFPSNEGMEGLAMAGDALLAGGEAGGFWLCPLKTLACREIDGPDVPGFMYKLTSLTELEPGGSEFLALYRFYNPLMGLRSHLRLLRLDGDRLVIAEDLAKIAPPLPTDNYEGVAAIRTTTGYRLYLISDGLKDDSTPRLLIYDWAR